MSKKINLTNKKHLTKNTSLFTSYKKHFIILFLRLALNYVAAATPAHGFWSTPYSQFSPASSTRTVVKVNHLEKYKIAA